MQKFDPQTLAKFDGRQSDKPVYIARNGKVYDVSASQWWKGGMHMKRHHAGRDLSADFSAAPHGEEVFVRVAQVGELGEKAVSVERRLPAWLAQVLKSYPILERHPHPMLVHYPIVFMFSTVGFSLLALLTGIHSFATTAFHCLGAGILFTPLTIATGLFTWWLNYQARLMRAVRIKIWTSAIMLLIALIVFIHQWLTPEIITVKTTAGIIHLLLLCSLVPLVSIVGWFGAQLTFPLDTRKIKESGQKTE